MLYHITTVTVNGYTRSTYTSILQSSYDFMHAATSDNLKVAHWLIGKTELIGPGYVGTGLRPVHLCCTKRSVNKTSSRPSILLLIDIS